MALPEEMQIVANQVKSLIEILPVLANIERDIQNNSTNLEFLANTAFLCRKTEEILTSVRKRIDEVGEKAEYAACMRFLTTGSPKYTTEYVTISPISTFVLQFPSSPKSEGFEEFVKQLPPEAIRPHYPTVCELVMKEYETHGSLPFNLKMENVKGADLKCRVTARKEL